MPPKLISPELKNIFCATEMRTATQRVFWVYIVKQTDCPPVSHLYWIKLTSPDISTHKLQTSLNTKQLKPRRLPMHD